MDELVRWLTACLDEDAARATAAADGGSGEWFMGRKWNVYRAEDETPDEDGETNTLVVYGNVKDQSEHIAEHDPARALREIGIDHELLREYEQLLRAHARYETAAAELAADIEHENQTGKWEGPGDPGTRQGALRREADYLPAMLHVVERWAKSKAAVYDQRPGYREEWRP